MRILLIEDEPSQAKALETVLRADGHVVETADIAEDGIQMAKIYEYDAILLDLGLPDMDGAAALRRMRRGGVKAPILVLTGDDRIASKVDLLSGGADDYMTKPFSLDEMRARLKAVLRRSRGHAENVLRLGRLAVDLDARTAMIDNEPLRLTTKEYAILELLMLRRGSTLSKESILTHLYDGRDEPEMKIIDVFVCKIRKKMIERAGTDFIQTVWGRGYMMAEPGSAAAAAAA